MPVVIRLLNYVHVPYERFTVPLSRRTLINRDNHMCQFCGDTEGPLTIDHIMPRSRGGMTSWENCVAACLRCNHKKGNKMPEEIGMHLRRKPSRPDFTLMAFVILGEARHNEVFQRYVLPRPGAFSDPARLRPQHAKTGLRQVSGNSIEIGGAAAE